MTTPRTTSRWVGAYPVLATPFDERGGIDLDGLDRLVDRQLAAGVAGVVCFGLASETSMLSAPEREAILDRVVARVGGRVPVVAGLGAVDDEAAIEACRWKSLGADVLMAFPPMEAKPAKVVAFFDELAGVGLPIVVQDAPRWTKVDLPVSLLVDLVRTIDGVERVKVEAAPTAPKMASLLAAGIDCIGGYGTLHLAEELDRGVWATMPGSAVPGFAVEVLAAAAEGRFDTAVALVDRLLPLTVFAMTSLEVFVGVQKALLHVRGVIATDRVRMPGAALDAAQRRWLSDVACRVGLGHWL